MSTRSGERFVCVSLRTKESHFSYYQWVPIVLALQAALFYMPNVFWRAFQWRTGFRLDDIVTRAQAAQKGGLVDRVLMNDLSILFECSLGAFSFCTNCLFI